MNSPFCAGRMQNSRMFMVHLSGIPILPQDLEIKLRTISSPVQIQKKRHRRAEKGRRAPGKIVQSHMCHPGVSQVSGHRYGWL